MRVFGDLERNREDRLDHHCLGRHCPRRRGPHFPPHVSNAVTKGIIAYEFRSEEARSNSLRVGEILKIEAYGGDGKTNVLLATLYTQQKAADESQR